MSLRGGTSKAGSAASLPFRVGDRVSDTWGKRAIVTEIDATAEHGLGRIRLRYDDGRELSYAVVAHDLKRVLDRE
jgi:hypothetical protein